MNDDMASMIDSINTSSSEARVSRVEREEVSSNEVDLEDVQLPKKTVITGSAFDGKFLQYYAYKSLSTSLKLTAVGGAWSETSWAYFKQNHTVYDGKRIKFEGKGIDLFPEMFKWNIFTIFTLGIYALWIPIRKEQWIVSHLHFEDEEFVEGYSFFDGSALGLIGINIFSYFLSAISGGLLLPVAYCYKKKWYAKHTVIGRKRLIFKGSVMGLYGNYIKWWLLSIITLGIYALWIPLKLVKWETKNTHIKLKSDHYAPTSKVPMIIGVVLAVICLLGVLLLPAALATVTSNKVDHRINMNYTERYEKMKNYDYIYED